MKIPTPKEMAIEAYPYQPNDKSPLEFNVRRAEEHDKLRYGFGQGVAAERVRTEKLISFSKIQIKLLLQVVEGDLNIHPADSIELSLKLRGMLLEIPE